MARGQFVELDQTRLRGLSALRSHYCRRGASCRRRAPRVATRSSSEPILWLHGILLAPASRVKFSRNQSPARYDGQSYASFFHYRSLVCLAPLAESCPCAPHFCWRSFDGLAFLEGPQHTSSRSLADDSWLADLVGFSDRLASQ